jgi:hypothetical protein
MRIENSWVHWIHQNPQNAHLHERFTAGSRTQTNNWHQKTWETDKILEKRRPLIVSLTMSGTQDIANLNHFSLKRKKNSVTSEPNGSSLTFWALRAPLKKSGILVSKSSGVNIRKSEGVKFWKSSAVSISYSYLYFYYFSFNSKLEEVSRQQLRRPTIFLSWKHVSKEIQSKRTMDLRPSVLLSNFLINYW